MSRSSNESAEQTMNRERLKALLDACAGANDVLILPHNDPDPDAISSALALAYLIREELGANGLVVYSGIIGRAENKALVRYLDQPLQRLASTDLETIRPVALVDTQPGTGNNALPPATRAAIVIDHHPRQALSKTATFADVRPEIGATCTMLTGYLEAAGVELPQWLATALFYGIKTDTMGLARGASPADVAAYFQLQGQVDVEALSEIEQAQLPLEYFKQLDAALHAARLYGDLVVSYVPQAHRPDLAAEMADLFLRLEGTQWVVCIAAYNDELILSVRTRERRGGAGLAVHAIVGEQGTAGGHGTMAAGHVPLHGRDPDGLAQELVERALRHLSKAPETGIPLTAHPGSEQ
ncbi:MAG: DHH family phosphoesterase [Anaerolineae bacterium]